MSYDAYDIKIFSMSNAFSKTIRIQIIHQYISNIRHGLILKWFMGGIIVKSYVCGNS